MLTVPDPRASHHVEVFHHDDVADVQVIGRPLRAAVDVHRGDNHRVVGEHEGGTRVFAVDDVNLRVHHFRAGRRSKQAGEEADFDEIFHTFQVC